MTNPPLPAQDTPAPLPDLSELIRQGEWRRALAVSRVGQAHPEVQEALSAVCGVQEAIRARRYPAARRNLADYRVAVQAANLGELALLQSKIDPATLETALAALDTQQKSKEADPAVLARELHPALSLPLTRAEALNAQAVLQAMLDDSPGARSLLLAALDADPGHYRALTNLGNLDLEAGDLASAEARYRQAVELCPEYDGAHHNLGVVLRRQGKISEAVSAIRRGQRLSMRRSREDTRAEVKEQLGNSPSLKVIRVVVVLALLMVIALALRGLGG